MTSWMYLTVAILFEVAGTTCMKLSEGFTRFVQSVLIFCFYGISFLALTVCLKHIDVSVAYAIWSGVGTALIAVISISCFREPISWLKAFSLCLIIIGVIGLNLPGAKG